MELCVCVYVCIGVLVGEGYHMVHIFPWIWKREKSPCAILPHSPHCHPHPQGSLFTDSAQSKLCNQMSAACFPHCPSPILSATLSHLVKLDSNLHPLPMTVQSWFLHTVSVSLPLKGWVSFAPGHLLHRLKSCPSSPLRPVSQPPCAPVTLSGNGYTNCLAHGAVANIK